MAVATHGVTTDTANRLLKEAGVVYIGFYDVDSPGTLLGATQGGNTFTVDRKLRDIRPDGARGPVKGCRRLEEIIATLEVNLLEVTAENLRNALAGSAYSAGTTKKTAEDCGNGDGSKTDFALDHAPVVVNSETVYIEGVAKTRGTDYTMDYDKGIIQFATAPGSGVSYTVTCTYTYLSAAATFSGGEIDDTAASGDYLDNVVLLVELTGYTNPAILRLNNVLVTSPLNIETKPLSEAVPKITFTAHYTAADLATEPWSITYPAS
ncbi:MAG: hypothetical protein BWY79_00651 [Actinobacteria bacterium ADurb.Bin444]|nr:MAG: hypothetical protein BWY79_00651 [Actinobacteria bacterium ADurb.Bin444]